MTFTTPKKEIIKQATEVVAYFLTGDAQFLSDDIYGNGRLELILKFGQHPSATYHYAADGEKDDNGYVKFAFPNKCNKENLQKNLEGIFFAIQHYISPRRVVSGKMTFYFKDGIYSGYEVEGSLHYKDLLRLTNNAPGDLLHEMGGNKW